MSVCINATMPNLHPTTESTQQNVSCRVLHNYLKNDAECYLNSGPITCRKEKKKKRKKNS